MFSVLAVAAGYLFSSNAVAASDAGENSVQQEALQKCEMDVCSENSVDEDATTGAACAAIPVRSQYGGAGRTTQFGRSLWCAAQACTGIVLDLYAGKGDTATLLADGLQRRSGQHRRLIVTFEISKEAAVRTIDRMRNHGVAVREVWLQEGMVRLADVHDALAMTIPVGRVGAVVFVGSTATSVVGEQRKLLRAVCDLLGSIGLVLLDPDIEMNPFLFAEDWRALESSTPHIVGIYNVNLPGGAGWVLQRLLHLGTHSLLITGHNDGGDGEPDELLRMRAWALLARGLNTSAQPLQSLGLVRGIMASTGSSHLGTSQKSGISAAPTIVNATAEEQVDRFIEHGASWSKTTFRSSLGGAIQKVHDTIEKTLVPVELQRPTSDLLAPPVADTNPHACFADIESRVSARRFRIPCFLTCEGPGFDPQWGEFRKAVIRNVKEGYPPDEDLFALANQRVMGLVQNDTALIIGRSRFMSRLRHEFTDDAHLEGFCLYGIANALFIRMRHFLELDPPEFMNRGKKISATKVAIDDMDIAFSIISDSNTKAGIEFSFLENSAWPIKLEELIANMEMQRISRGAPFQLFLLEGGNRPSPLADALASDLTSQDEVRVPGSTNARKQEAHIRLCGVGDHLTATFDAMLMVEHGLRDATGSTATITFSRDLLGRFCPKHSGQRHQCRQRCQVMGIGCGSGDKDDDPIAQWLSGVIHPETLEELPFDLMEKMEELSHIAMRDARISNANLLVCSHPTMLCIMLAGASDRPMFAHASSTLLYGMSCQGCSGKASTLRLYEGVDANRYLLGVRRLLGTGGEVGQSEAATWNPFVLLAEGAFLAEQIKYQVRVEVPWVPPLALYADMRWSGEKSRKALVLRSRYFMTLMGELLRSLLREIASINNAAAQITFLGADNQFDAQWLTLEQIASYGAAVLYPNDMHQRTFHEVYKMGVPLFIPDMLALYRVQRSANWGYSSYGGVLQMFEEGSMPSATPQRKPWWNSFNATAQTVAVWQHLADWEQFPYVHRFSSLPELLDTLLSANLAESSRRMVAFHRSLNKEALSVVATRVGALLR